MTTLTDLADRGHPVPAVEGAGSAVDLDVATAPDLGLSRRTAVVVGRSGEQGSAQTMITLQSLVSAWTANSDWDVVLLAPRDAHAEALVACLGGSFSVCWDSVDVDAACRSARASGREPVVLLAGDAVRPDGTDRPVVVPLVDTLAVNPATGVAQTSMSTFHPEADGFGPLQWDRAVDPTVRHPLVVFTNLSVAEAVHHRAAAKVAWLVESPEVYSETAAFISANPNLFDLVITSDSALAQSLPRAVVVPLAGCWIPPEDQLVPPKTRNVSMVASGKGFTSGHRMRQSIVSNLRGVDLYGRGLVGVPNLGPVENKADALLPYRFSIAVENTWTDDFFSEKIIDCFRTGTIPLWWGTSAVFKHFNSDGIITFTDLDDLYRALELATPEYYEERLPAVRDNFERAAQWRVVENRLLPHLKPYL